MRRRRSALLEEEEEEEEEENPLWSDLDILLLLLYDPRSTRREKGLTPIARVPGLQEDDVETSCNQSYPPPPHQCSLLVCGGGVLCG
jgi:hypothetical protein